jgi:hypothetical protein
MALAFGRICSASKHLNKIIRQTIPDPELNKKGDNGFLAFIIIDHARQGQLETVSGRRVHCVELYFHYETTCQQMDAIHSPPAVDWKHLRRRELACSFRLVPTGVSCFY